MATKTELLPLLEATGMERRVRNPEQWAEDCASLWSRNRLIMQASLAEIRDVLSDYLAESDYPPRLSDLVKRLKQNQEVRRVAVTGTGCADCGGTRWIEAAVWRGEHAVCASVKCPLCAGGASLGTLQVQWYQDDPSVTKILFGRGRTLAPAERGSVPRGQVIGFPQAKRRESR